MAIDEAVFLQSRESLPTLRFYSWLVPAVSIGHFQQVVPDIDLEACRKFEVDLVRRPTGGKAVFHDHDLTYAVVGRERRDGFPSDILGTYQMIGRCLIRGLGNIGIEATMAEDGRAVSQVDAKASCFAAPSRFEILIEGRKICGSAQMRSSGAFLQHGSLLLDFDAARTGEFMKTGCNQRQIERLRASVTSIRGEGLPLPDMQTLCSALKTGFEEVLNIRLEAGTLTREEEALKERLLNGKYANNEWNLEGNAGPFSDGESMERADLRKACPAEAANSPSRHT
jgi:lipoate-protein ligase A